MVWNLNTIRCKMFVILRNKKNRFSFICINEIFFWKKVRRGVNNDACEKITENLIEGENFKFCCTRRSCRCFFISIYFNLI